MVKRRQQRNPMVTFVQRDRAHETDPLYGPTVDVGEAAEILKVHAQTVLDLIAACVIPAGRIGRSYVMLTRNVIAYAEKVIVEETAKRMRRPFL